MLAHLIQEYWEGSLEKAVASALRLVTGTYGIAVVSDLAPGIIVGARKGSPLLVGVGEGEYFVASDVSAILSHTRQVVYLGDEEMAILSPHGYRTQTLNEIPVNREVEEVTWELDADREGRLPALHAEGDLRAAEGDPQRHPRPARGRAGRGPARRAQPDRRRAAAVRPRSSSPPAAPPGTPP